MDESNGESSINGSKSAKNSSYKANKDGGKKKKRDGHEGKDKPQWHVKGNRSGEWKPHNLDISKFKCSNCNTMGHYEKQCPKPNKREMKANLAKWKDDDPTLLMTKICDLVVGKSTLVFFTHFIL